MLYIILAISLTSPQISYCTKPLPVDADPKVYAANVQSRMMEIQRTWAQSHQGYTTPAVVLSTDPKYDQRISGFTMPRSSADFGAPIVAPPCRIFGSD